MTEKEASEWIKENAAMEEDVELDGAELECAFEALFGRPADAQDRREGLWSHLCASQSKGG
jgi:hypothetical protein